MEAVTRVCLLTGASGPLGSAFIERCAGQYAIVAVHHRNPVPFATQDQVFVDPLDPARPFAENDRAVHSVRADLARPAEIECLARLVADRFGPVDLVVNAAAARTFAHALADEGPIAPETVFAVNVLAPLRLCKALADTAWKADPAANVTANRNVVNVSSTAGLYVYPDLGQALYGASKAALNHLTYHLANDLWDLGIRVNAVAPDTFPGRVPTEQVVDAIVAFDRSDETGQVAPVVGP